MIKLAKTSIIKIFTSLNLTAKNLQQPGEHLKKRKYLKSGERTLLYFNLSAYHPLLARIAVAMKTVAHVPGAACWCQSEQYIEPVL